MLLLLDLSCSPFSGLEAESLGNVERGETRRGRNADGNVGGNVDTHFSGEKISEKGGCPDI
jgi:hypothetical protein